MSTILYLIALQAGAPCCSVPLDCLLFGDCFTSARCPHAAGGAPYLTQASFEPPFHRPLFIGCSRRRWSPLASRRPSPCAPLQGVTVTPFRVVDEINQGEASQTRLHTCTLRLRLHSCGCLCAPAPAPCLYTRACTCTPHACAAGAAGGCMRPDAQPHWAQAARCCAARHGTQGSRACSPAPPCRMQAWTPTTTARSSFVYFMLLNLKEINK